MDQSDTLELVRTWFTDNRSGYFNIEELQRKIRKSEAELIPSLEELTADGFIRRIEYENTEGNIVEYGRLYDTTEIKVTTLRMRIGEPEYYLHVFGWDLKKALDIFRISRARYKSQVLKGFQRDNQKRWIGELTEKLNSTSTFITDPITTCLDSSKVNWEPADISIEGISNITSSPIEIGTLAIPYNENFFDEEKPGELIDGQQRSIAAKNAISRSEVPILVTSYLINLSEADENNIKFLRNEFVKNNTHKNLPSDLVHLLSIHVHESVLKKSVRTRVDAVKILERLNLEEESPFYLIIKSTANPDGYITHRSVLDMVYESQNRGFLQSLDAESQVTILKLYWNAVKEVFEDAWKEKPGISKLTHGTGIYALGQLMDIILPRVADKLSDDNAVDIIKNEIEKISENCIWMEPNIPEKIDEWRNYWKPLQNIKAHKVDLSKKITSAYTKKIIKI